VKYKDLIIFVTECHRLELVVVLSNNQFGVVRPEEISAHSVC